MTWAYLRSTLYLGDPAWVNAGKAFKDDASDIGQVDCK